LTLSTASLKLAIMTTAQPFDILDMVALAPARGARAAPLAVSVKREITPADLEALARSTPPATPPRPLQRLRTAHHSLAMALAAGKSNEEAALTTGYDPARISVLKADPAFADLVAYYQQQREVQFVDVNARLAQVAMSAAEELQERLDEKPETFTNGQLREIASEFAGLTQGPKNPKGGAGAAAMAGAQITIKFEGGNASTVIEAQALPSQ
jgi:hypothetical protein